MSDFSQVEPVFAKAVASAVVADVEAAPSIGTAVRERRLSRHGLRNIMTRDLENEVRNPRARALLPRLRAVMRTQMNIERAKLQGGMGQWAELASAIAGAASGVYTAKLNADVSKDIAKIQATAQATALKAAQLQADTAKLQLAAAQGMPEAAASATQTVAGIPTSVAVPVAAVAGVGLLATVGYFMLRRKRR